MTKKTTAIMQADDEYNLAIANAMSAAFGIAPGSELAEVLEKIRVRLKMHRAHERGLAKVERAIAALSQKTEQKKRPGPKRPMHFVRDQVFWLLVKQGPLTVQQIIQRMVEDSPGKIPEEVVHRTLVYMAEDNELVATPDGFSIAGSNWVESQLDLFDPAEAADAGKQTFVDHALPKRMLH